jgi:hypothetical protein
VTPEFKTVLAGLCVLFGSAWFVRGWVRLRAHQRVTARELVKRTRAELCGALLVIMTGVMLGVHALG